MLNNFIFSHARFARAYFGHLIIFKTKHELYGSKNTKNTKKTQNKINVCNNKCACACHKLYFSSYSYNGYTKWLFLLLNGMQRAMPKYILGTQVGGVSPSMIITVANISIGPNPICGYCTSHECAVQLGKTRVTPEWRPKKRSHCDLKIADGRVARFAVASNALSTRCAIA